MRRTRTPKGYTTEGRADGTCGHVHSHFIDALRCLDKHWRGNRQTDRNPIRRDGQPLADAESTQLQTWCETPPEVRP